MVAERHKLRQLRNSQLLTQFLPRTISVPVVTPHSANPVPTGERAPVHLVLDNIRSAYNVGSAFRTADAMGIEHVHLCGMSAHPPHRKIEKTALGAQDVVGWTYYERTRDCLAALQAKQIPCIALEVTENAQFLPRFEWPRPVAVVFGNEVHGINQRTLSECRDIVQIPMRGVKTSLNVSTACSLVLYEILRAWGEFADG